MKSNKNNTFSYLSDKKTKELINTKLCHILGILIKDVLDINQLWSIAPYTIEEAYEVSQSIQDKDYDELMDELGTISSCFFSTVKEKIFKFNDVVKRSTRN